MTESYLDYCAMAANLEVDVKEAKDLKNTQYIGMQDPYLKLWVTSSREDKQNTSTYGMHQFPNDECNFVKAVLFC